MDLVLFIFHVTDTQMISPTYCTHLNIKHLCMLWHLWRVSVPTDLYSFSAVSGKIYNASIPFNSVTLKLC